MCSFLQINFGKDPRERYVQLLGYDKTELAKKVWSLTVNLTVNLHQPTYPSPWVRLFLQYI